MRNMVDNTELYIRPSDAARILSVTTPTVRRWADQGHIRYLVTPGGTRRYHARDCERLAGEGTPHGNTP